MRGLRGDSRRDNNDNGCPVPLCGTGRYKFKTSRICSKRGATKSLLVLGQLSGFALGQDLARVLVERLGLRNQVYGFFQLDVVLQFHFVAIVQSKVGSEDFALDLPLQPVDVG